MRGGEGRPVTRFLNVDSYVYIRNLVFLGNLSDWQKVVILDSFNYSCLKNYVSGRV